MCLLFKISKIVKKCWILHPKVMYMQYSTTSQQIPFLLPKFCWGKKVENPLPLCYCISAIYDFASCQLTDRLIVDFRKTAALSAPEYVQTPYWPEITDINSICIPLPTGLSGQGIKTAGHCWGWVIGDSTNALSRVLNLVSVKFLGFEELTHFSLAIFT